MAVSNVSNTNPSFEVTLLANQGASNVTQSGFVANRAYNILGVFVRFSTASASGTVNTTIDAAAGAPGSGTATSVLSGTISTASTTNTNTAGTLNGTPALAAGQSLGVVMGGTATGLAGLMVVATLQPA